ncbi:hypothetical protein KY290_034233 [Solanum tuberosum]|uniref:Uncharacterized protein n=1 Tax=Solanum tuberosum TaxID=4113 RepID=A0ABQ7U2R8_SOLTU|nr:hypothetical protein KY289_033608 [Solanum tuberosum]KAH0741190.1 hypothetical protein KY290_034233 [Solanum tuberosum]
MRYMLIIYIPLIVGEEKVVLLVEGLMLLRKDGRLLKWTNQPQKMITQLVILVPFQGVKLRNSLPGHQFCKLHGIRATRAQDLGSETSELFLASWEKVSATWVLENTSRLAVPASFHLFQRTAVLVLFLSFESVT